MGADRLRPRHGLPVAVHPEINGPISDRAVGRIHARRNSGGGPGERRRDDSSWPLLLMRGTIELRLSRLAAPASSGRPAVLASIAIAGTSYRCRPSITAYYH